MMLQDAPNFSGNPMGYVRQLGQGWPRHVRSRAVVMGSTPGEWDRFCGDTRDIGGGFNVT